MCEDKSYIVSQALQMKYGVPQSSFIGPLLIILFSNDLPLEDGVDLVSLLADDATRSTAFKDVKTCRNLYKKALTV